MQGWSEFDNFGVRAQRRPCEQSFGVEFFCEQQKNETECKDCELQIIQDRYGSSDVKRYRGLAENFKYQIKNPANPKHCHTSNLPYIQPSKTAAFTLAEVLIALVIIGIIAAVTLTTVMPNIQERVNSQRQANIVYKVTQATNLMKANGAMINGFESTDKFVDELQKYLKIMKRCDSEHIADCWPTKKVRTSEGKDYEVSNAKNRSQLGFRDKYSSNANVGIILADGACLIMTYNPANAGLSIAEPITAFTTFLPSGGKYQAFVDYTSNTTAGLAFVMDVNGNKGPNSETIGTKNYDIRNLNGAHFATGCGGTIVNGKCYTMLASVTSIDCAQNPDNEFCATVNPSHSCYKTVYNDRWAGGMTDCANIGGHVPTMNELYAICNDSDLRAKIGLADFTGYFWSSDLTTENTHYAYYNNFSNCVQKSPWAPYYHREGYSGLKFLCVGN